MNVTTGMKTVVTTGSAQSQSTAEKNLLSKDAPAVTSATAQEQQETFTFSEPAPVDPGAELRAASLLRNAAPAPSGFSALSGEDKSLARKVMKELNSNARLFARDDHGQLVRITPAYGKERLDGGEAIEVVTQLGTETSKSSRSSSARYSKAHFFAPNDRSHSDSSSSSKTVKAQYTSSPLTDWDSLLWHDDESDLEGIPGTATLPANGSAVTISSDWEKEWSNSMVDYSGFMGRYRNSNANSGFKSVSTSAN